jgi:hypothetical protein
MKLAVNHRGEHVHAGSNEAESNFLRCPACNRRVYHRKGPSRQPHFAHFNGNSNQDCELYYPGLSDVSHHTDQFKTAIALGTLDNPSLGTPALVWLDGNPLTMSLILRIPEAEEHAVSTLHIKSSLGQRKLDRHKQKKVLFVPVSLNIPPASVETVPLDFSLGNLVTSVLKNFRPEGNFFRAHTDGGVLLEPSASLDLGAKYYLITQRQLSLTRPSALKILSTRVEQKWTAYLLQLQDIIESRQEDLVVLATFLGRPVIPPRPKVEILWPPPVKFDSDGSRVYQPLAVQKIVCRASSSPNCITKSNFSGDIKHLSQDFYEISLRNQKGDVLIGLEGGRSQLVRFQSIELPEPKGITINSNNASTGLYTVDAREMLNHDGLKSIVVPSQRLWHNVQINKKSITPLPATQIFEISSIITEIDFGSFGKFSLITPITDAQSTVTYSASLERLIKTMGGRYSWDHFVKIKTKGQLLSWSSRFRTQAILPIILKTFKPR